MTGMTARWLTLSLAATTLACTVQRCESTIRIRDGSKSVSSSDSDSGLNSVSALLSSSDSDLALPPLPDVLVGAHYFAGWARVCVAANGSQIPGCYSHFHGYTPTGTAVDDFFQYYPTRVPLLGNLTTDVSTVIREVKAADAVLDFFDILYYDGGHDCGMPADPDADPGLKWCLDSTLAFMLNSSEVWANTTGRLRFYVTYSNDIDAHSPNAFVGPEGQAKWTALVNTWTTAMLHPRYLKINNRPVFKILIPDVFLTVECGSNATLAKKLLDQLRDTATKRGLEEPLVGAGWFNPSVPEVPAPRTETGYKRYGTCFVNCTGGCTIKNVTIDGHNNTAGCEAACNSTSTATSTCQAVEVREAGNASTMCTLKSVVGPGSFDPDSDTYVRLPGQLTYDFTGTYNSAPPVCPDQPNWECARYHNAWMPNATAAGAKIFPYTECGDYQTAARTNHSNDPTPYVPNVIAGFDTRPWEEHAPSFAMPSQPEWQQVLEQVKDQCLDANNRFGFPDASHPNGIRPAFSIYAWNEYGEGGILAPSAGQGFMKLDTIATVFNRTKPSRSQGLAIGTGTGRV